MFARAGAATCIALIVLVAAAFAAKSASDPRAGPMNLIVFAEDAHLGSEIRVVPAEEVVRGRALDLTPVLTERAGAEFGSPVRILSFLWSPTGQSFMYLVRRSEGEYPNYVWRNELWVMNIDGTGREMLEGDVHLSQCSSYLPGLIRWSGNPGDYKWIRSPNCDESASLSPDGTKVVYRATGIDSHTICIDDPDAEREWDSSCHGDGFFSHPAWSPR